MRFSTTTFPLLLALAACSGGETGTTTSGGTAAGTTEGSGAAAEDQGAVLAEVGDVKVYEKEFQAAAARKTPADGEALSIEERKEVLQKLVEEKALYQEAKKKGVDNDPKVQKVMINTLLRQEVYSGVRNTDFTQEELRKYFDEHRDEFVVPEKVQIKRIFVRTSDERPSDEARKLAEDLRKQVAANPAKFGEIASEHSEDPYRRRGGDLGFVGKDGKPGIDQAVVDRAFQLKVGDVSEAFEAGGGWNVVHVANKRERVERTFEQMRGSVLRKVKNEKYKEMYDKYVAEVSANYPVKVHEDTLGKVEIEQARKMGAGPGGPMGPMGPGGPMGHGPEGDIEGPGGLELPPGAEGGPDGPEGDEE
jgi:peptidyl-prolyl cis-trans isomerase C